MRPERLALAVRLRRTLRRRSHRRQRETRDHDRQHDQHGGDDQIGQHHRLRVGNSLGLRQHGGRTGGGSARGRTPEDQIAAEQWRERRTGRVERLHQVQPRRRGLGRPDDRDIRVGCDLQQRDPAGDHEQRHQCHAVGGQPGGGHHHQCAHRHQAKPDHHRTLIPDPLDQLGRRDGGEEIGDEPDALDQRRLRVAEVEHAAQVRQQRVVDDRDEAPHEEQAGQQRQRGSVARRASRGMHRSSVNGLLRLYRHRHSRSILRAVSVTATVFSRKACPEIYCPTI